MTDLNPQIKEGRICQIKRMIIVNILV